MKQAKILSTNHTSFTVSNLQRTMAYFRDALGFEVTSVAPRDPKMIQSITGVPDAGVLIGYVRGLGHSIELIEYTDPSDRAHVRPRPCDVGFAHIAYNVENVDDAIAASAPHGVVPRGVVVTVDQGPNQGKRAVYMRDPDGITIEFIGK
jgi:catechol 2,3-dioxygenase-like lactoylglutathione lyase family enzyme